MPNPPLSCHSHLLYKTDNCTAGREGSRASNFSYDGRGTHELLLHLEQALRLDAEADHTAASRPLGETALSSTLSRALCFIHRMQRGSSSRSQRLLPEDATPSTAPGGGDHASRSRLLCLLASPDVTSQYIPIMNAIFCAQRSDVIIDGCKLGPKHSAFLQQAAYLTGGIYLRPSRPQALAQYLLVSCDASKLLALAGPLLMLMRGPSPVAACGSNLCARSSVMQSVCAADPFSRQFLRLPRPTSVDLRASCFCHKRPIDQG